MTIVLKSQKTLIALLTVVIMAACQTPSQQVFDSGTRAGFNRSTILADGFNLMLMAPTRSAASQYLHVYLEGDGQPWAKKTVIADDPTSKHVLMLDLMALDNNNSLYIGRPCYNGTANEPECNDRLWTSARYSTTVVDAMADALKRYLKQNEYAYIRLFGHSGGGALAMLLAEQFPQVTDVITIAGNLDTSAWTTHHAYTPLYSSLNPSDRAPLEARVRQWHWIGGKDSVVPPALIAPFIQKQKNAVGSTMPGYTHNCCWTRIWPEFLTALQKQQVKTLPGDLLTTPSKRSVGVDGRRWQ